MADNLLFQPPDILDIVGPVIFLAGPIQGATDWQTEASRVIHSLNPKLIIASPRKDYPDGTFIYEKQVDWETHFLNRSAKNGVVMFWLASQEEETPGRSYAQTSRFELGEWKQRACIDKNIKLVVGIEEGFGNARYIRRRLSQDCPEVPVLDSLEATCRAAVNSL